MIRTAVYTKYRKIGRKTTNQKKKDYLCHVVYRKILEKKQSMKHQVPIRRVATIRVEPYLAKYARMKFDVAPETGGVIIPDSFSLYHCVWQAMSKWPLERWHIGVKRRVDTPEGNLLIHLPKRREEGGVTKDPRYWNYISPRHARLINRELKRLFDWEFHHYVEVQLEYHPDITKKEAVRRFIQKYGLGIDTEDALLKNFQRHERTIRIFLGLKKRKSAENKVKSTPTSTTDLSCRETHRQPPFSDAANNDLRLADGPDDGTDLSWCKGALLTMAITEGLQSLGKSGIVGDPSL